MDMSQEKLRVAMQEEDEVDLRKYMHILWHRRWLFLAVAVLVAVAAVLFRQAYVPHYQSTGMLVIEPETVPGGIAGVGVMSWTSAEFQPTQIALIKAHKTLKSAFKRLNLENDPRFEGMSNESKIELFKSMLVVEPTLKFSHLVSVRAKGDNYQELPLWANTLMEVYIEQYKARRRSSSNNTYVWLSEQLEILKKKVESSERALLEYKTKEEVVSLEKRQDLLERDLTELSKSYQVSQTKRMQREALLDAFKSLNSLTGKLDFFQKAESFDSQKNNQYIQTLRTEYNRLDAELLSLEKKYKPKHPKIVMLKGQMERITQRLQDEVKKVHRTLQVELQIAKSNEKAAQSQLGSVKRKSMNLAKQAIDYNVLRREADTNQKLYEGLLGKMKEVDIVGSVDADNIRIAQRAILNPNPVNKPLHWGLIVVAVLLLPLCLIFIVELFDQTVKSEDDINFHFDLPVLGQVKIVKGGIDTSKTIPSYITRAYRDICTAIGFYAKDHLMKTVLITSSTVGEGKTTDSLLLAQAFSATGAKVLLIDADVFKSSISKSLHLGVVSGLTDIILNPDNFSTDMDIKSLVVDSGLEGVDLLPAGLIPPNPSSIIRSEEIVRVLDSIKDDYDIILLDTPPLRAGLEVAVLASRVDAVLFSIRANHVSRDEIGKAIAQLRTSKCNIMGTILTFCKRDYRDNKGYYGYYGYYDEHYDKQHNSTVRNEV